MGTRSRHLGENARSCRLSAMVWRKAERILEIDRAWLPRCNVELLKEKPILRSIEQRGKRLMEGLREIFEENDIPVAMSGMPAMFSFALGVQAVTCQRDWDRSDRDPVCGA